FCRQLFDTRVPVTSSERNRWGRPRVSMRGHLFTLSWSPFMTARISRFGESFSGVSRLRVAFVAVLCLVLSGCGYNTIPTQEEFAKAKWADVQNNYQRRADLIPNLVATVQGYAK